MTTDKGKKSPIKATLILLCLVVLPVVSLYLMMSGLDRHKGLVAELSFYKDSIKTPSFEFLTQDSVTFKNEDIRGKVVVATFFETSCTDDCPKMIEELKRTQGEFASKKGDDKVLLLSISTNPEKDSVEALKAFAQTQEIDTTNWKLLTANSEMVSSFMQGVKLSPDSATQKLVMIENRGHLCNHYNLHKTDEVNRMMVHMSMFFGTDRQHLEHRKDEALYTDKEENEK